MAICSLEGFELAPERLAGLREASASLRGIVSPGGANYRGVF
jgi:hypothetical protein